MKRVHKVLILWAVIGSMYFILEGIWHIPSGGYANIIMLPIGGLCGLCIGAINQIPKFYNMKIIFQCAISTIIVLYIEFISGCILNLGLNLNIWDYSDHAFNILGQICLYYGVMWFSISPFVIWLEDRLRYVFWKEGTPYTLLSIYRDLITFN